MSSNAFINDTGTCSSHVCLIIGSFIVRVFYMVNFIVYLFLKTFFNFLRMVWCEFSLYV